LTNLKQSLGLDVVEQLIVRAAGSQPPRRENENRSALFALTTGFRSSSRKRDVLPEIGHTAGLRQAQRRRLRRKSTASRPFRVGTLDVSSRTRARLCEGS